MKKITYASLGSLGEEFHQAFDSALAQVRLKLGLPYPLFIDGKPRKAKGGTFPDTSPADTRIVLGQFQSGDRADTQQAIAAAKTAFPTWRDLGWQGRIAVLRKAAELMTQRQFEFAAVLTLEVGKNRFEAIAEVSEAIDLILYYCRQMEEHHGYEMPMGGGGAEQTKSVLRPYGAWAVVSPFNFPLALATGMAAGALIAGNTVVFKPASDTPWSGICLYEVLCDAGLPDGAFNFITGAGNTVGEELVANSHVDGFIFTGSQAVGLNIARRFAQKIPKPCITEMGGKNPAIIMPSANLDDATEGVMGSAFGMSGQKCSACSRLYLHKDVYKPFLELLVEKTKKQKVGDPVEADAFLGPLINPAAVRKYERAVRLGKAEGRIVYGGQTLREDSFAHGHFVEPVIVDKLPKKSRLFQEEFFAPVLAVFEVKSLDEAIKLANASEYGLTAGIFTNEENEQKKFFDEIEAGVTYCNRRGGATTGAWPGVQSFGGWKGSGSSGKSALGPYYVTQFMREQSQTVYSSVRH
ncbi:MAG: aldehyde dehydrogenase family protein [Verrucomicrobia bacterium]|nr:aldehyde dehydrogenase family protein [Verrucomicrobiota bacterium]